MKQNWYQKTIEQSLSDLKTTSEGLSSREASLRLSEFGPNSLPEIKPPSLVKVFLRQFTSPLVYILLLVSVVVFIFGDVTDSVVIAFILLFNSVIGTIQEGKANNTLEALKNFVQTKALVIRDGQEILISDKELVPGDVVVIREGGKVPADGRLIEVVGATVNEASLTGESNPIVKITEPIMDDSGLPSLSPADQHNMLFKGTSLVAGSSLMVVVSTGLNTEIGKLSQAVSELNTEIPLQRDIARLSKLIVLTVLVICLLLFFVGIATGIEAVEMVKTVVSLAVSLIPEGLPVVMTLILANGVWRMSQRKALVKKLSAVEALGQTDVIAVDKTGTITRNELIVRKIFIGGKIFEVTGSGYEPKGEVLYHKQAVSPTDVPELIMAGKFTSFADAELMMDQQTGTWIVSGDPTEAALIVLAEKLGYRQEDMKTRHKVIQEVAFDYHKKYRSVVFVDGEVKTIVVTGAPEAIAHLAGTDTSGFHKELIDLASEGLRMIAFGYAQVNGPVNSDQMPKLTFGGLLGLEDTLHREVPSAVADVKSAGMKVVMITGDWPDTARAIAKSAGIFTEGDLMLTGKDLQELSDDELLLKLPTTTVFARITPDNKLKIVQGYQKLGLIVAMTGDGVNDVPPLVAADLGIAMGRTGTEVTKESADIVLLDDNFSTIAAAVEEGRNIYKTIKRALLYLFSTSIGELFAIAGALFLGWALPVTAVQILWLNFVTDGFLTVSFAMEPKEGNLLRLSFKKPGKYIIDKSVVYRMVPMGMIMAVGTLILFSFYKDIDLVHAQTLALTLLAVYQWFNAFNSRSETRSAFRSLFTNRWLVVAMGIVITAQIAVVHWPPLQKLLGTTSLSLGEWLMIVGIATSILLYEEIAKVVRKVL